MGNHRRIDVGIFIAIITVLVISLVAWGWYTWTQFVIYQSIIDSIMENDRIIEHDGYIWLGAILRFWTFVSVKTMTAFVSFLVILIGTLYVLRATFTETIASVESLGFRTIWKISSPGLVIVFFGTALGALSLITEPDSYYTSPKTYKQNDNFKQVEPSEGAD